MSDERSRRIAAVFSTLEPGEGRTALCERAAEVLRVNSAGITLMTGSSTGPLCASTKLASLLENAQFTLGEGPCQDAFRTGLAVHEPRLASADATSRWPAFAGSALREGAAAAFAFPLAGGSVAFGVLTLYRDEPGDLSEDQRIDGPLVAEHLSRAILALQGDAEPHTLSEGLEAAAEHRGEVHQASGMVAVQCSISPVEALVLMRAHAFATDRSVVTVAQEIVARKLRLDD